MRMSGHEAVEQQLAAVQDQYGELAVETSEKAVSPSHFEIARSDAQAGEVVDVRVWVTRDEKVLLVREEEAPDYWIEPGGTVEPDERIDHAAEREVTEETGIDCHVTTPRAVRRIILQDEEDLSRTIQMLQVFVHAAYQSGTLAVHDDDVIEACWMTTLPDGFYSHVGAPENWRPTQAAGR
jgi:ADP-ribose pyrophosphatase YjhB (NUDIX family)